MEHGRMAGMLFPVTALPSPYGVGTLGKAAYDFIDFLHRSKIGVWQILPLLPTNYGDSPYQSCCASALNYYFIDFELLREEGLLQREDYASIDWGSDPRRVDYGKLFLHKAEVLRKAFSNFDRRDETFQTLLKEGTYRDFAIFMTLKGMHGNRAWQEWPKEYRVYNEETVSRFERDHEEDVLFWQFTQFLFLRQWDAMKAYAAKNGVSIMGDMPLYIAYDSVEVWKYGSKLFRLDEDKNPVLVAGVPPDAFSDEGQLWGNPVYDWEKMKRDGYAWWKARILYAFRFFDILRIDHFRGFDRYYAIPAESETAKNGRWEDGPKAALFADLLEKNIVAEDLGVIDEGVVKLMKDVGYPGMKIIEFAFDGNPNNEHLPSNYTKNFVAYTGTHDNTPLRQYIDDLSAERLAVFKKKLREECRKAGVRARTDTVEAICRSVVRLLFASVADTVIVPMGDLLARGEEARINHPSIVSPANWSYRYLAEEFTPALARRLSKLAEESKRS